MKKICTNCLISKPISEFDRNLKKCKECYNAKKRQAYQDKKNGVVKEMPTTKKCTKCLIEKPFSNFRFITKRNCYESECLDCNKITQRNWYVKNKEKKSSYNKQYSLTHKEEKKENSKNYNEKLRIAKNKAKADLPIETHRICNQCKLNLTLDNFPLKWKKLKCKECHKKNRQKKYIKNREKIINNSRLYYLAHKEEKKIYNINYRNKNKKKISSKQLSWTNNKLKTDPIFYIRHRISSAIRDGLKLRNGSKNGESSFKYLPYTPNMIKHHIQSLFEPWMTWKNHGNYNSKTWDDNDKSTWKWQIDHIIPHSTFPYKNMECKEFQECWALSNLRPLSAKQNIIDGASRIRHTQIILQP